VLSFDFRGHGQSSCTLPYTFAQLVDDIHALREHFVGGDKAVICGGSFGGYLAQQYAITYPDYVSHLVLRGTAPSHERECDAEFTPSPNTYVGLSRADLLQTRQKPSRPSSSAYTSRPSRLSR
jgi:pimeloyl-ACP methyl ester carboxylesterase